jgi:hypothetical protein
LSRPFAGSTANTTTVSDFWLPTKRKRPAGSRLKPRGIWPPVATFSTSRGAPLAASIAKTAIVSWSRFDA